MQTEAAQLRDLAGQYRAGTLGHDETLWKMMCVLGGPDNLTWRKRAPDVPREAGGDAMLVVIDRFERNEVGVIHCLQHLCFAVFMGRAPERLT